MTPTWEEHAEVQNSISSEMQAREASSETIVRNTEETQSVAISAGGAGGFPLTWTGADSFGHSETSSFVMTCRGVTITDIKIGEHKASRSREAA